MKQARKNNLNLTVDEFNAVMDELDKAGIKYEEDHNACYVTVETRSNIYHVSLTGQDKDIINVGALANHFYNLCKVHDLRGKYGYKETYNETGKKKITWDYKVAFGYSFAEPYYSRKPLKCWSYDINSAFPFAMLNPMPDTEKEPRYNDEVRKGEIGFYKLGGATTKVGEFADIIFPLMDSPFKEYVYEMYESKKSTDGPDRDRYKKYLNFATGLLARRNIFLRNALIYYSNRYIKKYIDDNTVYCNVDCIVSLVPRPDLPLGDEIGQFKVEHSYDNFKYIKSCMYQWNQECHYSGIPVGTITDIEDTKEWYKNVKYVYENGRVKLNEKVKTN